MAGKRQATTNLNHDNWDQEEEPEERGTFRTASENELKTRVIKKARRKIADAEESPGEPKSVFSGFSGFGKPAATAAASPFAFLSKMPAAAATTTTAEASPKPSTFSFLASANTNTKAETKTTTSATATTPAFSFGGKNASVKESTNAKETGFIFGNKDMFKTSVAAEKTANVTASNEPSAEYRESVAELNHAIMKFLKEHMDKSPYCILSPVFKNYEKHLKELQEEEEARSLPAVEAATTTSSPAAKPVASFSFGKPSTPIGGTTSPGKKPNCTVTSGTTTTTASTPLFAFGKTQPAASSTPAPSLTTTTTTAPISSIFSFSAKPATTEEASPKPGFFSFGNKDKNEATPSKAAPTKTNGFSFGLKSEAAADDKPSTSGFAGFGKPNETKPAAASTGFSFFGTLKPPAAPTSTEAPKEDGEEEDTPPKVEFKQVVEDDAIFSKRCKVFIKKDKDFADRGVGTLYLKPVKDTEKTQLLVRADTNLGNILVNLILSQGLPVQRMGKNNVMMMCVPTPEENKATSMLLRVKTAEEADELLELIQKHLK